MSPDDVGYIRSSWGGWWKQPRCGLTNLQLEAHPYKRSEYDALTDGAKASSHFECVSPAPEPLKINMIRPIDATRAHDLLEEYYRGNQFMKILGVDPAAKTKRDRRLLLLV
jgi:hypothetical protein